MPAITSPRSADESELRKVGRLAQAFRKVLRLIEIDFNDATKRGPADLRACISFLQRKPTDAEIATLLLTNGSFR